MSGGYYQFQAPQLRVLPFRTPDSDTEETVIRLVQKIAAAKSKNSEVSTENYEREIDGLLYRMYDATEEDIKRIEESGAGHGPQALE